MEIFEKAKKEPDTAATVTDSEQEDLVDVPADIVPQEAENVKPVDDLLPLCRCGRYCGPDRQAVR